MWCFILVNVCLFLLMCGRLIRFLVGVIIGLCLISMLLSFVIVFVFVWVMGLVEFGMYVWLLSVGCGLGLIVILG